MDHLLTYSRWSQVDYHLVPLGCPHVAIFAALMFWDAKPGPFAWKRYVRPSGHGSVVAVLNIAWGSSPTPPLPTINIWASSTTMWSDSPHFGFAPAPSLPHWRSPPSPSLGATERHWDLPPDKVYQT